MTRDQRPLNGILAYVIPHAEKRGRCADRGLGGRSGYCLCATTAVHYNMGSTT